MAVTVAWLVRQTRLGLTVVAGAHHVDREILWAHAIELADPGPYLSGGELVMTTGINVGKDRCAQSDYLARLVAADAAALAFDTGISYKRVPPGIIAAGDALGMPVLEVPASTPFIAITRTVIDRINTEQVKSVQRTVDEQERLARETLTGGVPAVVAALARSLDATVAAMSPAGRLLASAGPDGERVAALGAGLVTAANPGRGEPSSRVVADGDGLCTIQVLRAASSIRGYLIVRADRPLSAAERLLIAHSVSLISIELEKPLGLLDAEQRLRIAVTRDLIAEQRIRESSLLRYFGFDPADRIIAVVARDGGADLAAQADVHRVLIRTGLPFLMCPRDADTVVVLPSAGREDIAAIHRSLCRPLGRDLETGVSPAGGFGDIAMMVNQASAASRSGGGGSLRWFDELGLFGAVLSGRTPDELAVLSDALLPLVSEDLVATLTAFLENNGHLEGAAAALGVHRHTMRNRIGRIGELLGMSLDSADSRAVLLIALHARALLGGG